MKRKTARMLIGAHSIIYSRDAGADRSFLTEVLGLPYVDVGEGWLICGLPPAELAVHPSEKNDVQEIYLMCDDVAAFVASMGERGVACAAIQQQPWGMVTRLRLPGGGSLGVYEPRHARPKPLAARARGGWSVSASAKGRETRRTRGGRRPAAR